MWWLIFGLLAILVLFGGQLAKIMKSSPKAPVVAVGSTASASATAPASAPLRRRDSWGVAHFLLALAIAGGLGAALLLHAPEMGGLAKYIAKPMLVPFTGLLTVASAILFAASITSYLFEKRLRWYEELRLSALGVSGLAFVLFGVILTVRMLSHMSDVGAHDLDGWLWHMLTMDGAVRLGIATRAYAVGIPVLAGLFFIGVLRCWWMGIWLIATPLIVFWPQL